MSETETTQDVQFEDSDDLAAFEAGFFGQKPDAVAPTKATEVEQDAPEEKVEVAEAQTDDEDEAELVKEATPKKKTVQDRIDEVVRQREELKRESDKQLAELRAEVEKLKNPVKTTEPTKAAEPKPDAMNEDGTPVYGLGEFDPQYIRDLTKFTLEQERAVFQAQNAQAQKLAAQKQEQEALTSNWNGKLEDATKEYPDLIEKGQALIDNFANLDVNYASYLSTVLMSMDRGPDVLYYLSNHPDEATAIVNSGAQKATLALGRIEAQFLKGDTAPKPKVSKAPVPPPAKAQARGTNGAFISVAPDTDDLDAFSAEFFKPKKY
jgi:hypothetical protein